MVVRVFVSHKPYSAKIRIFHYIRKYSMNIVIGFGRLLRLGCFLILTGCGMLSMTTEISSPTTRENMPTVASVFQTAPTPSPTSAPTTEPTLFFPTVRPTTTPAVVITEAGPLETVEPTVTPTPTRTPTPFPESNVIIEIANQSGVSGYEIGIFGEEFGRKRGTVTILGADATVDEWTDRFVRVTVPDVKAGSGELIVTNEKGEKGYAPFIVYTIDPQFLAAPAPSYQNIFRGKPAVLQNFEAAYCNRQPSNRTTKAEIFLTDFQCGYNGIVGSGAATFTADSDLQKSAIIAVDTGKVLDGAYIFQFYTDGDWYPRLDQESFHASAPRDYEIQVSADSTDGFDGKWVAVLRVLGNQRSTRSHRFELLGNNGYRWVRLAVTDGITDHSDVAGRDFALREIRLFEAQGERSGRPYSFGLYGDSLTTVAFELMGADGFAGQLKALRGSDDDILTTVFGVIGKNSEGVLNLDRDDSDIYDALTLDENQTRLRYWGIALGTNDSLGSAETITQSGTALGDFGARLDGIVRVLIGLERVPILARMPDTDESRDIYSSLASKAHILREIDLINARYRLIPGPDFYTPFRRNIETEGGTWLGNDGLHHTEAGQLLLNYLWAEALARVLPNE
jgi:hypothetical protein